MDAECYEHNIKWDSQERGIECPLCAAEDKLARLHKLAARWTVANGYDVLTAVCGNEIRVVLEKG